MGEDSIVFFPMRRKSHPSPCKLVLKDCNVIVSQGHCQCENKCFLLDSYVEVYMLDENVSQAVTHFVRLEENLVGFSTPSVVLWHTNLYNA